MVNGVIRLGQPPVIRLGPPTLGQRAVGLIQRTPQFRVLSSPVTTGVLATTLATITPGGRVALGAVGRAALRRPLLTLVGLPTAAGALSASPLLRQVAKEVIDPTKAFERGGIIGEFIEDPKIEDSESFGEKFLDAAKAAGLLGVGAVGVGLTAKAIRDLIRKQRKKDREKPPKLPDFPQFPAFGAPPIATVPLAGTPSTLQPLAPVEKPPTEEVVAVEPVTAPPKPVSIKNVFKPSIDIRFRKSKKLINQQVNIK